jgi:hypothetical protein
MKNIGLTKREMAKETTKRKNATIIPLAMLILPEAKGLFFFLGCSLSDSRSSKSFKI